MRNIFFIFILILLQASSFAFVLERDSTVVLQRNFNAKHIQQLKKEHPYKYGQPKQNKKFDAAFFKAITRLIDQLLGHWDQLSLAYKILRVLLFIIGITFFVYLVLQIFNIKNLFRPAGSSQKLAYELMHENINEMDFPKLIDEAVLKKQYRIAIRLQYLHTLKLLSEMKYIDWRINKTNLHYILEMQSKPSSAVFSSLTNIFDWVWYGDFSIQEMEYEQYRETFENYKKSLSKNE